VRRDRASAQGPQGAVCELHSTCQTPLLVPTPRPSAPLPTATQAPGAAPSAVPSPVPSLVAILTPLAAPSLLQLARVTGAVCAGRAAEVGVSGILEHVREVSRGRGEAPACVASDAAGGAALPRTPRLEGPPGLCHRRWCTASGLPPPPPCAALGPARAVPHAALAVPHAALAAWAPLAFLRTQGLVVCFALEGARDPSQLQGREDPRGRKCEITGQQQQQQQQQQRVLQIAALCLQWLASREHVLPTWLLS